MVHTEPCLVHWPLLQGGWSENEKIKLSLPPGKTSEHSPLTMGRAKGIRSIIDAVFVPAEDVCCSNHISANKCLTWICNHFHDVQSPEKGLLSQILRKRNCQFGNLMTPYRPPTVKHAGTVYSCGKQNFWNGPQRCPTLLPRTCEYEERVSLACLMYCSTADLPIRRSSWIVWAGVHRTLKRNKLSVAAGRRGQRDLKHEGASVHHCWI